MLGPTDQGHFLKCVTTLGVTIVVGALGLGGFLLQAQSDLPPGDWRRRERQVFGGLRHQPVVLLYDEEAWADLPAEEFRDAIEHRRKVMANRSQPAG
jgi:hypothetical protein